MGFFSRTKSKEAVEPEAGGAPSPKSPGSEISDDYIAADIETALEAGGKEGTGTEPTAEAEAGDGAAANAEPAGEEGTLAPAEGGATAAPADDGAAATAAAPAATSAASLSKSMDGDGYVNAGAAEKENPRAPPVPTEDYVRVDEAGSFNGVKGVVQPPGYRDVKYAVIFLLHFLLTAWWFLDSFRQKYYSYYVPTKHAGLASFTFATSLAGLGLAFLTFGYMLNHSETVFKATAVFGTATWLILCVLGLIAGEYMFSVVGLLAFAAAGVYVRGAWEKIPFASVNLSVAIAAVTENEGLFAAALLVAVEGYIWLAIAIPAAVSANKYYGSWTTVIMAFSYYWTHQVMTNILAVGTAGTIGRWLVVGEGAPTVTAGLKETFTRVKTHSLGSICFGSLFLGLFRAIEGFGGFLSSMNVPLLPGLLERALARISGAFGELNQWAYVYVGLYGYPYTAAAQNSTELLRNKGWSGVARAQLSTNMLFMVNVAIGLLTGLCGLMFGAYEYRTMWTSGFVYPASGGFFVGFFVGFLMSSIMLSVVTATLNTLVVCLAESPDEFKTNHPELHEELAGAWKTPAESIPEESTP